MPLVVHPTHAFFFLLLRVPCAIRRQLETVHDISSHHNIFHDDTSIEAEVALRVAPDDSKNPLPLPHRTVYTTSLVRYILQGCRIRRSPVAINWVVEVPNRTRRAYRVR